MFETIKLTHLRNSEFIQFIKNLLEIVKANDPKVLKVKTQCDDLTAILTVLNAMFKTDLGSVITLELQEIDTRRDTALVGIEMQIKSYTYHFEQAKQAAAHALIDSLANYGPGISRLNYQAESSTIDSLISKWESEPQLVDALTTLNLNNWAGEIKTANGLFNNRYLARIKDNADAPELKTIELRKRITKTYRILLSHLEAHTILSGKAVYTETIDQINLLIEQYNKLVAGRKKSNEEEEILNQK